MPKIVVYAIAKNEAKHVYRWYNSIKEADAVYVLDTGSDDSTIDKLLSCERTLVGEASIQPFRFDVARNIAFKNAMQETACDYALFLDLDEVMEEGWYDKLQAALLRRPDGVNIRMIFDTVNGEPNITYDRLAVHNRVFSWKYPIHEILTSDVTNPYIISTDIKVYHLPDLEKERDYLPMLYAAVSNEADGRAHRYLGRELLIVGRHSEAITYLTKATELEESNYHVSEAYQFIAQCYEALNNYQDAYIAYKYGAWSAPDVRESWAPFASFLFRNQQYHDCISCVRQMLMITTKPTHSVICNEMYYRGWCQHMLAVCYQATGQYDLAVFFIDSAFQIEPSNPAIVNDMLIIRKIPITTTA